MKLLFSKSFVLIGILFLANAGCGTMNIADQVPACVKPKLKRSSQSRSEIRRAASGSTNTMGKLCITFRLIAVISQASFLIVNVT